MIEPPANYLTPWGEPDGFVTDIIRAMQKSLNDNTRIEFIPEARALKIAREKANILLFSFSRTPKREDLFHWIGKVQRKKWHVIALRQHRLKITSLEQLKALPSIGVVRGDVREEWLAEQGFSNTSAVASHEQNIKRLLNNRVTAIFYEIQGLMHLTANLKLDRQLFESVYIANQSDVYLLMSKAGTSPALLRKWQQAFRHLGQSGKLKAISLKWQQRLRRKHQIESQLEQDVLAF